MEHDQQRQRQQRSSRGNASGSGGGGASSGKNKGGGGKGGGKKPIKVVYISNPMHVKTSAAGFRTLVQELTGRHADPSKYSTDDFVSAEDAAAAAADLDCGATRGLSPGDAVTSSDTVVASPGAAPEHQPDAAVAAPNGGEYDEEEDEDGFRSQLLENNYAVFSPPTLLYDHHPHSKCSLHISVESSLMGLHISVGSLFCYLQDVFYRHRRSTGKLAHFGMVYGQFMDRSSVLRPPPAGCNRVGVTE